MAEFKSWRSYREFERSVRAKMRYVRDSDSDGFLAAVLSAGQKRVETIAFGEFLWRAQLGNSSQAVNEGDVHVDDIPVPHEPKRMKPPEKQAREGRINPKGIPCLYLATHHDTALAEVRPWKNSLVSVAQFRVSRDLRIVNLTSASPLRFCLKDDAVPEKRESAVWADIDKAFARPVERSDEHPDYVPTQIISEVFKAQGFDGVAYRSSLGPGHNVALFRLDAAEVVSCFVFEAVNITFEFKQKGGWYGGAGADGIGGIE